MGIAYRGDQSMGTEWVDFQDKFNEYFEQVPDSSIVLFDLKIDSILDSAFGDDFDFMFLNTNSKKGKDYTYAIEEYGLGEDNGIKFKFNVHWGSKYFDFDGLNSSFDQAGINGQFKSSVTAVGLGYQYGQRSGGSTRIFSGMDVGWYLPQEIYVETNSGLNYILKGYYIKSATYFDVLAKSKALDALLGLSLNYERLSLSATEFDAAVNNHLQGFIGNTKTSVFANPAFTIDLSAGIDVNLGKLLLGYTLYNTFDLSNKSWRSNGEIISHSPETSLSGLGSQVRVGLSF